MSQFYQNTFPDSRMYLLSMKAGHIFTNISYISIDSLLMKYLIRCKIEASNCTTNLSCRWNCQILKEGNIYGKI